MSALADTALAAAQLPPLPGVTEVDRMVAGRALAAAALKQYVPDFAFDPAEASKALSRISVWQERNANRIEGQLATLAPTEKVTDDIKLELGVTAAQQYILACFTEAAMGMGPHLSGLVDSEIARGTVLQAQPISDNWRRLDVATRTQVFQTIIKMEGDGTLKQLFVPPPGSTNGFGAIPLLFAAKLVAIVVVVVVAMFLVYFYATKRLSLGNAIMKEMCQRAEARGDQAAVLKCIEEAADLQKGDPFGVSGLLGGLGKAALWVGLAYVGVRYGIPALASARRTKEAST